MADTLKSHAQLLPGWLAEAAEFYGAGLPRMIDEETRLEAMEVEGNELRFVMTLVTVTEAELGDPELVEGLEKMVRQETGWTARLKYLLGRGAELVYIYSDKDGESEVELRFANKATGGGEAGVAKAKAAFDEYLRLEKLFDDRMVELYADDAVIRNTRRMPDGTLRAMGMNGANYKKMVRASLPAAKARGDVNAYSDVLFEQEGAGVRVTASRFSELKKYWSPVSLLFGELNGKWMILEESSESRA